MTLPLNTALPVLPQLPKHSPSERIRNMAAALLTVGPLRRGYERDAVDQLVNTACTLLDEQHNTIVQQRAGLDGAWTELQARRDGTLPDRSMHGPVGAVLADVQRAAMQQGDQMQRAAGEQSRAIVQAAQSQAGQIIAAANARAAAIDEHAAETLRVAEGLLRYVEQAGTAFTGAHAAFAEELRRVAGSPTTGPANQQTLAES